MTVAVREAWAAGIAGPATYHYTDEPVVGETYWVQGRLRRIVRRDADGMYRCEDGWRWGGNQIHPLPTEEGGQ